MRFSTIKTTTAGVLGAALLAAALLCSSSAQADTGTGSRPASSSTPSISAETTAAGYTHQKLWTFTGNTLPPQWSVYDSPGTSTSDSRNPALVSVSDGILHVQTNGAEGSGLCLCKGTGKPSQAYGRWDVFAKPAVDPHHDYGILLWPNAGQPIAGQEIDTAEFPGPDKTVLQNTVHLAGGNDKHSHFTNGTYGTWHKYSVLWTPTSLSFWVDNTLVWQTPDASYSPSDVMHLVLQGGAYSASTPTSGSSQMLVKAVRYFR